jgi:hypothetical protein
LFHGPSFRLCKHKNGEFVFYKDVEKRIDQLEDAIDLVIEELSTQDRKTPKERKVGGENLIEFLIRTLGGESKCRKHQCHGRKPKGKQKSARKHQN